MWTPDPQDWRVALEPYDVAPGEWGSWSHGSPQWHAARRRYVTATQIRDALGLGYDGSSMATVHQYRTGADEMPQSWLMALGTAGEPALLRWWSEREGVSVKGSAMRIRDGIMASLDGTAGCPVEAKIRQPLGDDPYRDGGCTPGEACQVKIQCLVMGAPYGLLVVARGADVHTRLIAHPDAAEVAEIEAAADAILRADREGWPAVAEWVVARGEWDPYRNGGGLPAEPQHRPELAREASELVECEALLRSARSEVRALESRREAAYCRISAAAGEAQIDTGAGILEPVYRMGRLSGWKVRT